MTTPSDLEAHRVALTGHCYRMLGSISEADDAVQETMVRAWKSLERFEDRSSLKTWLTRIATNVCLDALSDRSRRARPMELGPSGSLEDEPTILPHTQWIEPAPDALMLPSDASPSEIAILRQSVRLAFVAALQHLPPKQRAVLLLMEVLGWAASDVASSLDTSVASVNSALQRARATLATRDLQEPRRPLSDADAVLVDRYVNAFERYDVDALAGLLRDDATLSMPPYALWLQGPENIKAWFLGPGSGCRGSRLIPTSACGAPAFAQYRPRPEGGHFAWGIIVLDIEDGKITAFNSFLDVNTLFPKFGLPLSLEP